MGNEIEVEVTPGGRLGEYQVRVIRAASGGEPRESLHLDVPRILRMRPVLESAVLASAAHARGGPVPELEQPLRDVGQELFEGLFTGAVRETYRASVAVARERGTKLRVVLHLDAAELSALPWEAMWDPEARAYLCRKEPLVRHVPAPYTPDPLPVTPPIRVLCLVASPRGLAPLDVDRERQHLDEALLAAEAGGRIHVEWLVNATWDTLQDRLLAETWHVLHFIGHGDYDPVLDQGRVALVREEDGGADWVEAGRLIDLLNEADPTPRLVVLNSCSSGQSGIRDVLSGTAAALVSGGISAVAAMQFRVSDPAAVAFPRGFYKALAAGKGVDIALSSGRVAILGRGESLEWVTPVLYVRGGVSQLFTLGPASRAAGGPVAPAAPLDVRAPGAREAVIETVPALPREVTDDPRYQRAQAAYWRDDWDEAVTLLEQVHAEHPTADIPELARARRKRELATWWARGGQAGASPPADAGDSGSAPVAGRSTGPAQDGAVGAAGPPPAGKGSRGRGELPPPLPAPPAAAGQEPPPRGRPPRRLGAVIAAAVLLLILGIGGAFLLNPGGDGEPGSTGTPSPPPTRASVSPGGKPTDDGTTPASLRPNLSAFTLLSEPAEIELGQVKDFTVHVYNDPEASWAVGPSAGGTLSVSVEGAQIQITGGSARHPPASGCGDPVTARARSTLQCAFDSLDEGALAVFTITLRGEQLGDVDVKTFPTAAGVRGSGDTRRFAVTRSGGCVVPDVVGWAVGPAEEEIKRAGLVARLTAQDGDADPGTVLRTDPPAETGVECESTVELSYVQEPVTGSGEPSARP